MPFARNGSLRGSSASAVHQLRATTQVVTAGIFVLNAWAYGSRLRAGRSPFSPTLWNRRRSLPTASLKERVLPRVPYLRPTPFCDAHAPEVIALADDLRRRARDDWAFARAAFDSVRNEIAYAIEPPSPNGVVGTLRRGSGVCLEKVDVLVALARAGGIPARYAVFGTLAAAPVGRGADEPRPPNILLHLTEGLTRDASRHARRVGAGLQEFFRVRTTGEAHGNFLWALHPHVLHAELKVGDLWIPADPTWGDAEAAGLNLPLPRLGYDPLVLQGLTGTVAARSERNPEKRCARLLRYIWSTLGRGTLDRGNRRFEDIRARGGALVEEVGPTEYIRRWRRSYVPVPGAPISGFLDPP